MANFYCVSGSFIFILFSWGFWGLNFFEINIAAQAQLIPDSSLGPERSRVNAQGNQTDLITGGATRGNNLFHSFEEFHVSEGRSLYFTHPGSITQIFSRVTGNSPSHIDGTLGVLGNADLFFLNPNGILFGREATLDLSGSFIGSTAESLLFDDFEFGAITPQPNSLFTMSSPIGLQLGQSSRQIINRSVAEGFGLTVQPFQTLALVARDINFEGGQITVPSGQVELGGIRNGTVELRLQPANTGNSRLTLGYGEGLERGAIALSQQSHITARQALNHSTSQTRVVAQNLALSDRSTLTSETSGPFTGASISLDLTHLELELGSQVLSRTTGPGDGGAIQIDASETIELRSLSPFNPAGVNGIVSQSGASGPGGAININTQNLYLRGGSRIESAAWSTGRGGDLTVNVSDTLLARGVNPFVPSFPSGITPNTFGAGVGGTLQLNANNILIQEGATLITGVISNRDELIQLLGNPQLQGVIGEPGAGTGTGGDIQIVADRIVIEGASALAPDTPSQIGSLTLGSGNTGDVVVSTQSLTIQQGGLLLSSAVPSISSLGTPLPNSGTGNVGHLEVQAETIEVSGVNPFLPLASTLGTQTLGAGDAGQTLITTNQLRVLDGGSVSSGTFTAGNAGELTINAAQTIEVVGLDASGIAASIGTSAEIPDTALARALFIPNLVPSGNTGEVNIETPNLRIAEGGRVSVRHRGTGDAGDVRIHAGTLFLQQGGRLGAETNSGTGGNIRLKIQDSLILREGSTITAGALGGEGDGGNITLETSLVLAVPGENSDIVANAQGGKGGNIILTTNGLFGLQFQEQLTRQSDISASSNINGLNGTVRIDLLSPPLSASLTELFTELLNPEQKISTNCAHIVDSRFIASGRGGLPPNPRSQLFGSQPLEDWRRPDQTTFTEADVDIPNSSNTSDISAPTAHPIEAQGWYINSNNDVKLVAQATFSRNIRPESKQPCSTSSEP